MSGIKVPFTTQDVGYDRDQVDRYIVKITDEYTNLQEKYTELHARYDAKPKQTDIGIGMEAVSKAIVDAEVRAIQIIAEANNEAAQIKGSAHVELVHLQQEKDRVVSEIFDMIKGLKGVIPFTIGDI